MWLAFWGFSVVGAFLLRFLRPAPRVEEIVDGLEIYQVLKRSPGSPEHEATGFRLGVELDDPATFRVHRESLVDELFKWMGVAHELQTGDKRFDRNVYIAADHPAFRARIRESEALRKVLLKGLAKGFDAIWSDGRVLWIEHQIGLAPDAGDRDILLAIRKELVALARRLPSRLSDPTIRKVIAIEALIWSLGAWAAAVMIPLWVPFTDVHRSWGDLLVPGLVLAVIAFFALIALCRLVLGHSSRGHRVLVETAFVLMFALPVIGVQGASFLNRELDSSPPQTVIRPITGLYVHTSMAFIILPRGVRFEVLLGPGSGKLPDRIAVSHSLASKARRGRSLEVQWSPGALGFPWYRSVRVIK